MLFKGNFQRLMQHQAPSFDKWSGKTAEQFMLRKDGPLWQQYRIGIYTRTGDNLISHKMRAAVALHRGDIMLFTGNFQPFMQHKAPSFDKWSG
ncbi:MAG: hypothetical protein ACKPKO_07910, partial [Candidatus Fonsibacter sp.]